MTGVAIRNPVTEIPNYNNIMKSSPRVANNGTRGYKSTGNSYAASYHHQMIASNTPGKGASKKTRQVHVEPTSQNNVIGVAAEKRGRGITARKRNEAIEAAKKGHSNKGKLTVQPNTGLNAQNITLMTRNGKIESKHLQNTVPKDSQNGAFAQSINENLTLKVMPAKVAEASGYADLSEKSRRMKDILDKLASRTTTSENSFPMNLGTVSPTDALCSMQALPELKQGQVSTKPKNNRLQARKTSNKAQYCSKSDTETPEKNKKKLHKQKRAYGVYNAQISKEPNPAEYTAVSQNQQVVGLNSVVAQVTKLPSTSRQKMTSRSLSSSPQILESNASNVHGRPLTRTSSKDKYAWSKFQSSPDPKDLPIPSFLSKSFETKSYSLTETRKNRDARGNFGINLGSDLDSLHENKETNQSEKKLLNQILPMEQQITHLVAPDSGNLEEIKQTSKDVTVPLNTPLETDKDGNSEKVQLLLNTFSRLLGRSDKIQKKGTNADSTKIALDDTKGKENELSGVNNLKKMLGI